MRDSSNRTEYVPALCTHRPSLFPIETTGEVDGDGVSWRKLESLSKSIKSLVLEEAKVVTRFP